MKLSHLIHLGISGLLCCAFGSMQAQEKPLSINRYLQLNDDAERYYDLIEQATLSAELNAADATLGSSVRDYLHGKEFQIAYLTAMQDSLKRSPQYRVAQGVSNPTLSGTLISRRVLRQFSASGRPSRSPFCQSDKRSFSLHLQRGSHC